MVPIPLCKITSTAASSRGFIQNR